MYTKVFLKAITGNDSIEEAKEQSRKLSVMLCDAFGYEGPLLTSDGELTPEANNFALDNFYRLPQVPNLPSWVVFE